MKELIESILKYSKVEFIENADLYQDDYWKASCCHSRKKIDYNNIREYTLDDFNHAEDCPYKIAKTLQP